MSRNFSNYGRGVFRVGTQHARPEWAGAGDSNALKCRAGGGEEGSELPDNNYRSREIALLCYMC